MYRWPLDGKTCHKPVCSYLGSECRGRICFTGLLEFLHGQLVGFCILEHIRASAGKKTIYIFINSIKWWWDF
jgi:hypothetical protein